MSSKRAPTILDVAKTAGVSKSVVSRVLTGTGQVSSEAREKVTVAVSQLGYRSNSAAQALVTGKTHNVGLLVRRSTAPYYGRLMFELQALSSRSGYRMLTVTGNLDTHSETRALQDLVELGVDGLVIGSGNLPDESFASLTEQIPTVVVGRPSTGTAADVVRVDPVKQAVKLGELLHQYGHEHIGLIAVPRSLSAAPRMQALLNQIKADGFTLSEATGSYDYAESRIAAQQLLTQPKRPTVFVSLSADGAWALLRAANELGLAVPNDLSIISLDDPDEGFAAIRDFTHIPIGMTQIATAAWNLLATRLESPDVAPQEVLITGAPHVGTTLGQARN